jgi:uncharacterized protein (TIGR02246 family)
MTAGFTGPFNGSKITDEVQSLRFLGDDLAVVVSRTGILLDGERAVPDDRWVLATWVISRRTGRWLVEAYHNCAVTAS